MSAEAGVFDVFVFGGPKSKLKSLASPYAAGRAFVYHDPVKDFYKLSDFEVVEPFSGLRENLKRICSAALIAELLIKTSGGGGDYPEVLGLARDALRGLESLPEERSDYPLILFLWRLVGILGLMPDPEACAHCGADMPLASARIYSHSDSGFLCSRCAEPESQAFRDEMGIFFISAGAARWLERATSLPFAQALGVSLDARSLAGLKGLAFDLARRAAESPLSSLSTAAGIL